MEPAGGLGLEAGELGVPVGKHPQNGHMILGGDCPQPRLTERHDRHRTGIVGVVLLRPCRIQHPDPGRLRRGHIHHVFAGGDQLLGQQVAVTVGGLDGPPPSRELLRPRQQDSCLALGRANLEPSEHPLTGINRSRGMGSLMRVDSDHHRHHTPPLVRGSVGSDGGHS